MRISRRIMISAPKESVRLYFKDLKKIPQHSRRVQNVQIMSQDEKKAVLEISGRLLGIPWRAAFQADFNNDGGCRFSMIRGPLRRMTSCYNLRAVSGGTIITNDEEYIFPILLGPVGALCKGLFAGAAELELRAIKEGAERLNRQIKIREIEASL